MFGFWDVLLCIIPPYSTLTNYKAPYRVFLSMMAFSFVRSGSQSPGKINGKSQNKTKLKTKMINLNEAAMKQNL